MNKVLIFLLLVSISSSLNAAIYKGQRIFVKKCLSCHKDFHELLVSRDMKTWEVLMSKKGDELAEIHLKDIRAEKSWEYFNGAVYGKKSKHLKHFLVEYAKDSGKIPALD